MPVARNTQMIAWSRRQANARPWQARSSFVSSPLASTGTSFSVTLGGAEPGHRVREFFLVSPPPEELLQCPVLVAGVRVAVALQQADYPALDILPASLLPAGAAGLAEKVSGGEPLDCLGVHAHCLAGLA